MNKNADLPEQAELDTWIKKHLDASVKKYMKQGNIESVMVEAKPAWVLPFQILIGKIRTPGSSNEFFWFICGEVPTDYLESSVAFAPRDAAKHFAMKWQLAAARHQQKVEQNPATIAQSSQQEDPAAELVTQAEALYGLVEDDRLWLQQSSS